MSGEAAQAAVSPAPGVWQSRLSSSPLLLDMMALGIVIAVLADREFCRQRHRHAAHLRPVRNRLRADAVAVLACAGQLSDRLGRGPVALLLKFGLAAEDTGTVAHLAVRGPANIIEGLSRRGIWTAFAYIAESRRKSAPIARRAVPARRRAGAGDRGAYAGEKINPSFRHGAPVRTRDLKTLGLRYSRAP